MIYIKSILAGLAALLLAIPTIVGATVMFARQWLFESDGGGVGAVSIGMELLLAVAGVLGALAFVAGFMWEFRRRDQVTEILRALTGIGNLVKGLSPKSGNAAELYAIMSNIAVIQATLIGMPRAHSN